MSGSPAPPSSSVPAADGDLVSVDLRAAVDGEELEDATADDLSYRIGTGDLVDGIDDAVIGLSAGDLATFRTTLVAGEHAGREADVTVQVNSVSERVLPDVDDDFAQLASEFDTVDELRADLAEKIRRVKNLSQGAEARDKVLEALLGMTEVAVPESIVKAEIEVREHDAIHSFDHDEAAFAAYLEGEGKSREEFDAEIRSAAEEAVRTQLLLDAMAEAEGIGVNQDEFTERVIYNAQRFGMSPGRVLQAAAGGQPAGLDLRRRPPGQGAGRRGGPGGHHRRVGQPAGHRRAVRRRGCPRVRCGHGGRPSTPTRPTIAPVDRERPRRDPR